MTDTIRTVVALVTADIEERKVGTVSKFFCLVAAAKIGSTLRGQI